MGLTPPTICTKWFHAFAAKLPSMRGKTVAITGTTSGLGFVAARTIVRAGGRVLVLNRPSERAATAARVLQGDAARPGFVTQVRAGALGLRACRAHSCICTA
jgi:NAD(P)-dependent dehydrogenase (short-subunit alcohol dehydrogenase family)